MQVRFVARENGPERLVTEAEVHFDDGPLAGTKLLGLSLWRSPEGEVYVTFPSRAFGAGTSGGTSTTCERSTPPARPSSA